MTTEIRPPRTIAVAATLLLVNYAIPDVVSLIKYGSIGTASSSGWVVYLVATLLFLGLARILWLGWPFSRVLAVIIMAVNLYHSVPLYDEFAHSGLVALWLEDVVIRVVIVGLLIAPPASRRWFAQVRPGTAEVAPSAADEPSGAAPPTPSAAAEIRPAGYGQGA
ncbi:hypothetical protein [Catellatospora paridis]|uniref:hypothetical protein n=1 Tax=Catellatospora paridis TaxID=1617086 RepID=UPI0012D37272|nr:hypothetical protein [Catellatospora paridis]